MSLEPTFFGYVATSNDALLIFEACRSNGILTKVSRRPHDRERDRLIKSGNIFVFDEQSSGIRRWTDGVAWSPSRILGNYLIYRQLERPLQPGEKKRAQKHRLGQRSGSDHPESPERLKSDLSDDRSPSPREAGGPIRTHSKKLKGDSSSNASDNGSVNAKPRRWSEEQEKELAGSLTDSYGFKEGGLIKKTMSVEYEGTVHHLVSYYTIDDVMLNRLPLPSQDPRLADLVIGSDLMTRTNFRVHPSSEAGNTVSRNSPTQQRTQMLLQQNRRPDDPRHAQGYGPMNGYNAPPPVHGNGPPEGYPDPSGHYGYGPGPQPSYHGRYFPPNPPMYQTPMFMHNPPPPHLVNPPYYGPQQPPPQYGPGPPQHPPPVDVKREGPPPSQYYPGYTQPYPQNPTYQPQMNSYPPRQPPPQQPPPQQQPLMNQQQRPYDPNYQPTTQPDQRGQTQPTPQRFDGPTQSAPTGQTGGSPHHTPAVPAQQPPPTSLPPPTGGNGGPSAPPLSRNNSGSPPPGQTVGNESQSTFGWNQWSQSQASQAQAPARA